MYLFFVSPARIYATKNCYTTLFNIPIEFFSKIRPPKREPRQSFFSYEKSKIPRAIIVKKSLSSWGKKESR
ncbi:hypothetical protein BARVI_01850 [Barnesiella viscericola DSM 18177]|uniref:Uncharacterized protein n=1 Tax=Barnesiella viscericola DSM 18177 TaxID=880074 RepID=W0EVJ4_9BACT|nr:hypothetical protein BARVI_01850 [Barnesiella viscericola DSM 18177]